MVCAEQCYSYQLSWALPGIRESGSPVRKGFIEKGRFARVRLLRGDFAPAKALLDSGHAGAGNMAGSQG